MPRGRSNRTGLPTGSAMRSWAQGQIRRRNAQRNRDIERSTQTQAAVNRGTGVYNYGNSRPARLQGGARNARRADIRVTPNQFTVLNASMRSGNTLRQAAEDARMSVRQARRAIGRSTG